MELIMRRWLGQQLNRGIWTLRHALRCISTILEHTGVSNSNQIPTVPTVAAAVDQMCDHSETSCCGGQCCQSLREEFRLTKFKLNHDEPTDFCRSQWQHDKRSIYWLIYRWLVAIFFAGGVISSLVVQFAHGCWFIYLTNWGFAFCMYTCTYGAIIATFHYFNQQYFAPDSLALKIYWASHFSTLVLAIMITLVFWSFIFPIMPEIGGDIYNIWAHACNSAIMLLDHMLVAFPTRLMHFIYPFAIGISYGFFSLFYYVGGGLDPFGHNYIYPILKWSQPGLAIGTTFGCIVIVMIFCLLLFWLYQFRLWLFNKYGKTKSQEKENIEKV